MGGPYEQIRESAKALGLSLPEDEMAAFKACCADVRENMKLNPLILQD